MHIIDLGAVSVETQGPVGPVPELGFIAQLHTGLTDE
ncbi:benenodin family lasso peptide [Sphingomonas koreensis]|nr:benenodin family lasso peptide [Sphingomonas koreensis]